MTEDQMKERTREFAVAVVRMVQDLPKSPSGDVLGKQLLRSATSVGANYRSACRARSKPDFVAKLAVAEEECDESQYWLELLHELKLLGEESFGDLHQEAEQLTRILAASGKTAKENIAKK